MKRRTLWVALACVWIAFWTLPLQASPQAATKSSLRVLLVSHNPEAPQVPFADMATERTWELYRERAAAWKALLDQHFESVRLVYGPDYTADMSNAVDVTLFDARPKPLRPSGTVLDPITGQETYQPAQYLPDDFDRPALMIAENSPLIGEPLGLKLDWL
ncbi:MAG: hypothetical protein H6830_06755 [Planctomycetes bacterium]|nr:hypothetical protein [Planctomycetota bacterium]MCB9911158.1 hypothetical protein [Planctomycetota bacterium]MCB9911526.1 hypothetical protein [Planctomycetota bacterium]HPF12777.1 hypothetical protein [Planctomycetota bacterium]HRV81172.1 hypothetical protein [Planctomycetota bacterium]